MQNGMTKEQAEEAASNRIKTEKIIAGVAGMTIAAAVTEKNPIVRMQVFNGKDQKAGAIYGVYNEKDSKRYGAFVKNMKNQIAEADKDVYKMKLNYGKNFKVASDKHSREEFGKMLKSNPEFLKQVKSDYDNNDNV